MNQLIGNDKFVLFENNKEIINCFFFRYFSKKSKIGDIVFEIMQSHANGIHFREHNAGVDIDDKVWKKNFGNKNDCYYWMK